MLMKWLLMNTPLKFLSRFQALGRLKAPSAVRTKAVKAARRIRPQPCTSITIQASHGPNPQQAQRRLHNSNIIFRLKMPPKAAARKGKGPRTGGDSLQKFYAVKQGHTPGVYTNWDDCVENTTGFKGAQFKKFDTEQEARDFVAGTSRKKNASEVPSKYYGVAVGHHPGVYTDWDLAKEQIKDVKGPKYKKFETKEEAEAFVKSGGTSSKTSAKRSAEESGGEVPKKGKKRASVAMTNGDDVEEEMTSKKKVRMDSGKAASNSSRHIVKVWTDGSALGNGKAGASAGTGVYFGPRDERNVSESLAGSVQTNNRAELTGVLRALEAIPATQHMEIITDSNYSINCTTLWHKKWEKNGWMTSTGAAVENKDLIEKIRAWIDRRDAKGAMTKFTWIKGHANDPGNTAADELAVAGARLGKRG